MKFIKITRNKYCIKLERGDEIVKSIQMFCTQQKIKSGYFLGLGATNDLTIGIFNDKTKKYISHALKGDYEITSLIGNISSLDEKPYLHVHINVGDKSLIVKGGHLNKAVISVTAELILVKTNKKISRSLDQETGLNLLNL
ncbi:MAG: DNA-binding protein [Mycoplasmataceae bacterium]|jgi:predicted DNA-binding protein with PD1-like motif|nr:DNA-binding protein [Mycoplasmataceae bacterium]